MGQDDEIDETPVNVNQDDGDDDDDDDKTSQTGKQQGRKRIKIEKITQAKNRQVIPPSCRLIVISSKRTP